MGILKNTMSDPNLDNTLHVLSDHLRRETIQILRQTPGGEVGVEELLDELIRRTGVEKPRDRVAIQLHHQHLPKLAAEDLIAYDQDAGHVRYRPDQEVETVMDGIAPEPSPLAADD